MESIDVSATFIASTFLPFWKPTIQIVWNGKRKNLKIHHFWLDGDTLQQYTTKKFTFLEEDSATIWMTHWWPIYNQTQLSKLRLTLKLLRQEEDTVPDLSVLICWFSVDSMVNTSKISTISTCMNLDLNFSYLQHPTLRRKKHWWKNTWITKSNMIVMY